ncbi:hypothetical protein GCM10009682_52940 [Luedemannella flava]|uniref:Uncharacterized protein n=1 Tax=Luedemannella flava TaxID=349316 RepID=A0ABN2MGW8_9ACTN
MKLYAETPRVRTGQLFTDVCVVAWIAFWIWASFQLHDLIMDLAGPGERAQAAGEGLAGNLSDAGSKAANVPLVGSSLSSPFTKAAEAAQSLADAGQQLQVAVEKIAYAAGLLVVIVPLALVVLGWLPWRVRWVRRATAAAALRDEPAGVDMLALRALARRPLRKLVACNPNAAKAWRDGDPEVVRALAAMELAAMGLSDRDL